MLNFLTHPLKQVLFLLSLFWQATPGLVENGGASEVASDDANGEVGLGF